MSITKFEEEGFYNFGFLLFLILLMFFALYYLHRGFQNMLNQKFVPSEKIKENKKIRENFINFPIEQILLNIDDDGNLMMSDSEVEKQRILQQVEHKKNQEVKLKEEENRKREGKEDKKREDKKGEDDEKGDDDEREVREDKRETIYIVDKRPFDTKTFQYTFLKDAAYRYLDITGYYEEDLVLQVKDIKNKEVTKIKNKIYNKYYLTYQTREDDSPQTYFIEYRPSQDRFMKLYNANEDKVFYFEKVDNASAAESNEFPLYHIFSYAEPIGQISLSTSGREGGHKRYQLSIDDEKSGYINLIGFTFVLFQSLSKEGDQ